ncbi:MAG TPA: cytochrome C oxidase subunit IV family protein [Puia sp.]|nr:cytochrome C oxidase subunit IV family protein [Puia sp.]
MSTIQTTADAHHVPEFSTKPIWRTFWILLGITAAELIIATIHLKTGFPPKFVVNGIYLILTCAKAFYIIAEFMHLRHELKNLIMTLGITCLLFVWFIISFLYEGNSYKELRNRYDRHHLEQSKVKVQAPEEHEPAAKKPGSVE